jgi:hypothetical protein
MIVNLCHVGLRVKAMRTDERFKVFYRVINRAGETIKDFLVKDQAEDFVKRFNLNIEDVVKQ